MAFVLRFLPQGNEESNRASLDERRSMAEHLQELHDWLVRDQQDRHASFRGLQERIQHLHSVLSQANLGIAPPPPLRKFLVKM